MAAVDAEMSNLLEELRLTASLISESNGQSSTANMDQILQLLNDPISSCRTQESVYSTVTSWQSLASNEEIENTMIAHSSSIFDYILRIIKSGSDADFGLPNMQISAYHLTSCIQKQMKNSTSSSFIAKMVPAVLTVIRCLSQSGIYLREKSPNSTESNVSSRAESVKLLIKCIPTDTNNYISETISTFFSFMKLISVAATPVLRGEIVGGLVAIGQRDKSLFDPHIYDLVSAMRFGEADELIFILRGNYKVFNELAPKVLEHNVHYLVTLFGFPSLSEALLLIATTDSGASKLSSSVTTLTKDMECIQAAGAVQPLITLLLRVATVRPASVSRHLASCLYAYKYVAAQDEGCNHIELLQEETVGARRTDTVSYSAGVDSPLMTSVLLVSLLKLLAAVSRAGVEETYASLSHLTSILRCGKVRTSVEMNALIGAIDIAKNKCPKGDIFADDTLAALSVISHANRSSYANIMKWNKGKWALEGDFRAYIEDVDLLLNTNSGHYFQNGTSSPAIPGTSNLIGGGCFSALSAFFSNAANKQQSSTVFPSNSSVSDIERGMACGGHLNSDAEKITNVQNSTRHFSSPKVAPSSSLFEYPTSGDQSPLTPVAP